MLPLLWLYSAATIAQPADSVRVLIEIPEFVNVDTSLVIESEGFRILIVAEEEESDFPLTLKLKNSNSGQYLGTYPLGMYNSVINEEGASPMVWTSLPEIFISNNSVWEIWGEIEEQQVLYYQRAYYNLLTE